MTAIANLNSSGRMKKSTWGGARTGAGRHKTSSSIRSVAEFLNKDRPPRHRISKTKVWELLQSEKIHPILSRWFAELPVSQGQKKYGRMGVPNKGLSVRTLVAISKLPYKRQFDFAALILFRCTADDVPDEFKQLFSADEDLLQHLAQVIKARESEKSKPLNSLDNLNSSDRAAELNAGDRVIQ